MITLKQALDLVQAFQNKHPTMDQCSKWKEFAREEHLRTELARRIAEDNPPLDPRNPQDLTLKSLDLSTILSHGAQNLYEQYKDHLARQFGIRIYSGTAIKTFSDIRETFKSLRRYSQEGGAMTWRQDELTAFRKLCEQLALDNGLKYTQVMSEFTELEDLFVSRYTIKLAEQLFEVIQN